MAESVEAHLESLRVGDFADSGEFSLASDHLLRELGQVLSFGSAWLVKLMQALACWKATAIDVVITRRELTVTCQSLLLSEVLDDTSLFIHDRNSHGHRSLLLALVSLSQQEETESLLLEWVAGSKRYSFVSDKDFEPDSVVVKELDKGVEPIDFFQWRLRRGPRGLLGRMFYKADYTSEILTLRDRSIFHPAVVRLDRREMTPVPGEVQGTLIRRTGLLGFWKPPEAIAAHGLFGMSAYFHAEGKPDHGHPTTGHYLAWVVNGMLISYEREEHPSELLTLITFVDGKDLPTDISTMKLLTGASHAAQKNRLREGFHWRKGPLHELLQRLESAAPPVPTLRRRSRGWGDFEALDQPNAEPQAHELYKYWTRLKKEVHGYIRA